MGCDIHCFIEEVITTKGRDGQDHEWAICSAAFVDLGRNYTIFSLMAGVRYYEDEMQERKPVALPKGVPRTISFRTKDAYTLRVTPEDTRADGECPMSRAQQWLAQGVSEWWDDEHHHITHPDYHSGSWMTIDELKEVQHQFAEMTSPQESWYQKPDNPVPDNAIAKPASGTMGRFGNVYVEIGPLTPNGAYRPLQAVIAFMEHMAAGSEHPMRLVFWFDN